LLLLDEPSAGLNEAETESLAVVLEKLVSSLKLTLIVIDHDISFLRRLCPRLLAMSNGQLICDDSTAEVLENPIVVQSYLGDG
jgi:branched-chain amino acid transport system ATP-binding protein